MIHTELSHAGRYAAVHPHFGEIVEYLKKLPADSALGRHDIGDTGAMR